MPVRAPSAAYFLCAAEAPCARACVGFGFGFGFGLGVGQVRVRCGLGVGWAVRQDLRTGDGLRSQGEVQG